MNILVVTQIYPSSFSVQNATPLVHYFTRKWVEQGHHVKVVHLCSKYPSLYYWFGKHFNNFLSSKLGMAIANQRPWSYDEVNEGVNVYHYTTTKYIPHGRHSKKAIKEDVSFIETILKDFRTDVMVGHWANPTLEVLSELKAKHNIPCAIVLHETASQLNHYFGREASRLLSSIDIIGYRSRALKEDVEKHYGEHRSFMAYSGVPESFLEEASNLPLHKFKKIENFIFIGALIKRKYPAEILTALVDVFGTQNFAMTYIGSGKQDDIIRKIADEHGISNKVTLTGRISRDKIINYLIKSEVFIMISKSEVYGLVYLEAMAFGCIPIASRNEGFDGIIINGENGFLCEAGNSTELSTILNKIRNMTPEELSRISQNARNTAMRFGDGAVARKYLEEVKAIKE